MADPDLEEWLAMSDEEQERAFQSELRLYNAMIDAMPWKAYMAYRRSNCVRLCKLIRRNIREFPELELFQQHLRAAQRRLLAIRLLRRGKLVGNA